VTARNVNGLKKAASKKTFGGNGKLEMGLLRPIGLRRLREGGATLLKLRRPEEGGSAQGNPQHADYLIASSFRRVAALGTKCLLFRLI
jgi:hypothetical protein